MAINIKVAFGITTMAGQSTCITAKAETIFDGVLSLATTLSIFESSSEYKLKAGNQLRNVMLLVRAPSTGTGSFESLHKYQAGIQVLSLPAPGN